MDVSMKSNRFAFRRWLIAGVLLLNLFVIGMLVFSLGLDYQRHRQEAGTITQNLAGMVEQSIDEMLQKIDLTLLTVADELQAQLAGGRINKKKIDAMLALHLSRLPGIHNLLATDKSGTILFGLERPDDPGKLSEGISLADRDYFIHLRNNPQEGLLISKPILGKLSRRWIIVIARRYTYPDGSFGGVLLSTIKLEHFVNLFSTVKLGRNGVITLLDGEPSIIARFPEPKGIGSTIGFKITIPSVLQLIKSGEKMATFTVVSGVDNVERTFSYRKVPGHPLFILIGLGAMDYLQPWRKQVVLYTVVAACFAFFSSLFAWLINRGLIQREHDLDALRQSEERYRSLFDGVPTGVFRTTPAGQLLDINPAYVHILGYPDREALLSVNASNLYPTPEYRKQWQSVVEQEGIMRNFETQMRRHDGAIIWVRITSRAVKDSEDLVLHYEGTLEDITVQKHAESERATLEEQLRQSQKMETVGLLAGGVAHDFNNLLTPILGYSDMLISGFPESDQRRMQLQQVKQAAIRAKDLTRQLLTFSRKQMIELKAVNLGDIILRFENMLRRTIRENIRIEAKISSSLSLVRADAGQIEQVLINLSINAQDAMLEGGTLSIEAKNINVDESYTAGHAEIAPGPYVMLAVSDTGIGMDKQMLEHIFEPFYTTKELGRGTGLGLSTVYGIVKQHGGSIFVYSELNRGSIFKVFLPRMSEEGGTIEEHLPLMDEVAHGVETILLVEDSEIVRTVAYDMLKRLGYQVLVAESPDRGIEIVKGYEGRINLILTDVVMPRMNGRELFDVLRHIRPELKVLFMSGYTSNVIGQHGILDKEVNFLPKPFSIHALSEKVRHVLDA